ncbi:MAG: hypothetical protein R2784_11150 [Saprospiraceae bacterium]
MVRVNAIVTPASGTFQYLWSTGSTSNFIENLGPGTYSLTVTDRFGCSVSDTITLVAGQGLICSASVTSDYNGVGISERGGSDGEVTATASGGSNGILLFGQMVLPDL